MTDILNIVFLAIVQGLTEFLPVSSSGHLVIARSLLKMEEPGMLMIVMLHAGTGFAVIFYYRRRIWELIQGFFRFERASLLFIGALALSLIPAGSVGLCCKERLETMCESVGFVGFALLFTGCVLLGTRFIPTRHDADAERPVGPLKGFLIGMAQMVALLPGVSRSGMTISAARFLGVHPERAAEFSFLMVLPVIFGEAALDAVKWFQADSAGAEALSSAQVVAGLLVSGVVGYLAVAVMVRLLDRNRFWLFGVYCLAAGLATLLFLR